MLEKFRATRQQVLALYDSLPDLDPAYRRDARKYLEEFYSLIARPDRVKKALVDGCTRARGCRNDPRAAARSGRPRVTRLADYFLAPGAGVRTWISVAIMVLVISRYLTTT